MGRIADWIITTAAETCAILRDALRNALSAIRAHPRSYSALGLAIVVLFVVLMLAVHHLAVAPVDNCVFGADTHEIASKLSDGSLLVSITDLTKHSPQAVIYSLMTMMLRGSGVPADWATAATIAFFGAAGVAILFIAVRNAVTSWTGGAIASLLAVTLFGSLVSLALVETYAFTFMALALALGVIHGLDPATARPNGQAFWVGITTGLAGLAHLPAAAILLFYVIPRLLKVRRDNVWPALAPLLLAAGIVVLLVTLPQLPFAVLKAKFWLADNSNSWSALDHFGQAQQVGDVLASLFVFSSVSPLPQLNSRYFWTDLSALFGSPIATLAFVAVASAVITALTILLRSHDRRSLALSYLAYIATMLAFHIYFNPYETILYSVLWTTPTAFIVGIAAARSKTALVAALAGGLLAGAVNIAVLTNGAPTPEQCNERTLPEDILRRVADAPTPPPHPP